MVELRKRKTTEQPPVVEKKIKKSGTGSKKPSIDAAEKKESVSVTSPASIYKVGDTVALDDFGGQIEINDGTLTTLKDLVNSSESGVVLFTYPKASTPGCTKQACMFRDSYDHLTSTGLSIYGLSADSPKANSTFKTKQKLPYPLLCDRNFSLIAALGLKKLPRGTFRGVFAINKNGEVLLSHAGGPDATVEATRQLVAK